VRFFVSGERSPLQLKNYFVPLLFSFAALALMLFFSRRER
jgi:hypothetical protein